MLASPALAVRIRAVLDNGHALSTCAVTGLGTDPELTPYLLLAHDEGRTPSGSKRYLMGARLVNDLERRLPVASAPTAANQVPATPASAGAVVTP